MNLTVFIGFNQLDNWLAIAPVRNLINATGVRVSWRPLLSSLGNVTATANTEDPLAEYKARRATARQKAAQREHERLCSTLGITVDQGHRQFDAEALAVGLLWAGDHYSTTDVLDYLDRAFTAIYVDALDVENDDIVAELSSIEEAQFTAFRQKHGSGIRDRSEQLVQEGVLSAPAFVLEGEVFHGREHLPLINWRLTGSHGSPPV